MKTTIAILTFLAVAICLGAAYAFMPHELVDNDPDMVVRKRMHLSFDKEFPYAHISDILEIQYIGAREGGKISGYSEDNILAFEPGIALTCGMGLQSYPLTTDRVYTTPVGEFKGSELVISYYFRTQDPDQSWEYLAVTVQL